ncbi:SufD family Fe-S cluster assembly protein [Sphingomonas naphthae]|uniref:SufD family Fe-S cluster assembly protein n=1 Tax=Sphingomonas naphthae TaxID=1813468 RepID=A0ABY7TKZ8_9SPHN|nr:SufD family Fe-S cluster assembly protein [Sphingomonas naphthae]WCT73708.1 SufD family Fe-S cluster assembly protein [Sphingomonas naphthae]
MSLTLPSTRDEAWRWFAPAAVEQAAALPAAPRPTSAADMFADVAGPRLVFFDGVYQPAESKPGPIAIESLAIDTAHPLGARAAKENGGGTGWRLMLDAQAAADPIQIVHWSSGGENHLPGEIVLAEDSAATVTETFVGRGWANRLTRIDLARSARLMRGVRLLHDEGFVSLRDEAQVATGASLVSTFLGHGTLGSRIDVAATLNGEGAFAEVGGALLATGQDRHEAAVVVRHAAPGGVSRQLWRLVAHDRGTVSAAARVEVARGAQRTDAEQSLRGLLLDRTATVNLKPELEIFADDVKCAHGATVGELDARALFYLASRGIPEGEARAMLTRAFAADAFARLPEGALAEGFADEADRWLDRVLAR